MQSGRTEVQKLKLEVLAFLGSLGGRVESLCDQQETKADIYLDKFLPHTCELAMSSSNRQTKVVACELLHSFVILLLGNDATRPAGYSKKNSAEKIYSKLFPVLLSLSVDMEQVAKQLFEPLVFQLIHWFTKFPKRKETSLLLDTLMDGVESVNNSALREFSAMCVAEFLRWSIKHTSVEQQRKNPENVKQLLRRMFSMARHPGSGKRRGACFVYNHTYMILREEESLIDKFTMEILVCFIDCLACAHADDPSLETHQEAKKCLSHVKRILKAKAQLFLEPSKQRRIPLGWTTCTLKDAILWLLSQVGRSETECRHACTDLISNLAPCLSPELNSRHKLIQYVVEKQGIQYIIDR
ncbi:PRKDC [Bugula neritina]|uniref:PRKDC n=1 Tax=Bugula neritina TaxID=10212 RepID=A0A7J7JGR6_BUGNE|nr:PRKDC [Bugula neritina]